MTPVELDFALFALDIMPAALGIDEEPMWVQSDRNIKELEGLLERPFQKYAGKELYKTPAEKTAVLFFETIKGHKFENGNKRTAVVLALALLRRNGYWLKMSSDEMYKLALKTAEGENNQKAQEKLNKIFADRIERASLIGVFESWFKTFWK